MLPSPVAAVAALGGVAVAMIDVWAWERISPLLFGWVPYGLWWPTLVGLLAIPAFGWAFDVLFDEELEEASR